MQDKNYFWSRNTEAVRSRNTFKKFHAVLINKTKKLHKYRKIIISCKFEISFCFYSKSDLLVWKVTRPQPDQGL